MSETGSALAEGFYWYAEKLMWGYEDMARNPEEALRFYRQAADLGLSDAHIRIGQLQEYGKGTAQSPSEALMSYQRAAEAGNWASPCGVALPPFAWIMPQGEHAGGAGRGRRDRTSDA